jgi:cytochrome c peroxidase
MSCASCHRPELAYTDGLPLARGAGGKPLARNTPTLLHVGDQTAFFWDGRVRTLEEQALHPIQNADEMNHPTEELANTLNAIPGYRHEFQAVYRRPVTPELIGRALAAFERTIVARAAPLDRYLGGERRALSPAAQRGMDLFQDRARCAFCHKGLSFTDSDFHNIGTPPRPGMLADPGRFAVTRLDADRGKFKTPTLRNVAMTAPYMHNGVFATLEDVVEFYNRGGGRNAQLDDLMQPLHLKPAEMRDLVEFLKSLTGTVRALPPLTLPE